MPAPTIRQNKWEMGPLTAVAIINSINWLLTMCWTPWCILSVISTSPQLLPMALGHTVWLCTEYSGSLSVGGLGAKELPYATLWPMKCEHKWHVSLLRGGCKSQYLVRHFSFPSAMRPATSQLGGARSSQSGNHTGAKTQTTQKWSGRSKPSFLTVAESVRCFLFFLF